MKVQNLEYGKTRRTWSEIVSRICFFIDVAERNLQVDLISDDASFVRTAIHYLQMDEVELALKSLKKCQFEIDKMIYVASKEFTVYHKLEPHIYEYILKHFDKDWYYKK